MEKIDFETILSECITNPEGTVANTELDNDSKTLLQKTNEAIDIIKKNWESLYSAQNNPDNSISTEKWFEEKVKELKEKQEID